MNGACQEHGFGELFCDGDAACAAGDIAALSAIAEHLVEHVPEPLHCELVPMARACRNRRRAATAWRQLKERLEAS